NMHCVHDQHLSKITWVREHFLVAGHPGIETDLSASSTYSTEGLAHTGCSVFQNQDCRFLLLHLFKTYAKKNIQSQPPTLNFSPMAAIKKGKINILPPVYSTQSLAGLLLGSLRSRYFGRSSRLSRFRF